MDIMEGIDDWRISKTHNLIIFKMIISYKLFSCINCDYKKDKIIIGHKYEQDWVALMSKPIALFLKKWLVWLDWS